jgi:hypothetical protein
MKFSNLGISDRFFRTLRFLLLPLAQASALAAAPEPPRQFVDTTYVPPTGQTIVVDSGGSFQAALDMAQPGDMISLRAGATFVGPFTLPVKSGTGWIIVRTSAPDAGLPPPGVRITPAYASAMPKIVSADSGGAIVTAPGAHHFRFIGVEFTVASNVSLNYGLVRLGEGTSVQNTLAKVPHHLIFDRVYVHGNPSVNLRRGFALNSAWTAVIDSHVSGAHEVGADSQAIAAWNGPGPFKIVNNYLEGAGENVLFGGADPTIVDLVPSDIEVRGNYMYKPLSWRIQDPGYAGIPWTVKNLFELKNARRVLVEGNVFENNWLHAQNGFAILFTPRNQDGSAPWSVVEDVTFVRNIVRHSGSAVNVLGSDDIQTSQQTRRILIQGNLFEDVNSSRWGGSGRLFQMLRGINDIVIDHNTAFHSGEIIMAEGTPHVGVVYRNNLTAHNTYGVGGNGTFGNPLLTLSTYFPGVVFLKNVLMGGDFGDYPPGNHFPVSWIDVGFVDLARGDYRLSTTSPYRAAGTDGNDIGIDVDALTAATAGAVGGNAPVDSTPPIISGVQAASITSTSAAIRWLTNEGSDSLVEFGTSTAYGRTSPLDPSLVTVHSRSLTGLDSDTIHHYRVRSRDAMGNLAISGDFTFQTLPDLDTGSPTVSMTAPSAGATVSGSVTLSATATDDVGVAGVQFRLDGAALGAEDTAAPYLLPWNSTSAANGTHTLTAVARDAAGNSATSAPVSVTVSNVPPDTTSPTVSITSPGSGATLSGNVTVSANASDNVGVAGVQFRLDGAALGVENTIAPYSISWNTTATANGTHTLGAVVRDAAGNTASASTINVSVANGSGGGGSQVVWMALTNVTAQGSVLRKTGGCNGCPDAGAVSVQSIPSGNGYLEVTASETTTLRLIGLSRGNRDTTGADIDFALRFGPNGGVEVRENGQYRRDTTYAQGTRFRISVESGVVKYYRNGVLFYSSTIAPAYPLLVDTSLLTSGSTLGPVTLSRVSGPYYGQPAPFPGTIQAEDFDLGGEGQAYHDLVAGNQGALYRTSEDVDIISPVAGSHVVNNFQTGEWLEYTFSLSQSGVYRLEALASSEFTGTRFRMEIDGVNVTGSLTVPNTGSWRTFQWVGRTGLILTAGTKRLRIHCEVQYFNLDAVRLVP